MSAESPSLPAPADPPAEALWEFVRLVDYVVPGLPARKAAADALAAVGQLFRRTNGDAEPPVIKETELRTLPDGRLQRLVPRLDWSAAAAALDRVLADWLRAPSSDPPVKFVIGQPHCGHAEILGHWGALHEATLIEAPTVEQILAGGTHWIDNQAEPGPLWILPNLEWWYLRHPRGLALVRTLFERTASGGLGRGVIACDSWAWAYLQRIWPMCRPDALTLQAFDGERLSRLFAGLAWRNGRRRRIFRNAATGKKVLSAPREDDEVSPEIIQLAAHCRGNVGTARRYWRESLRSEPDEANGEAAAEGDHPHDQIVWVSAALREYGMATDSDEDAIFVLHALLLHGGLPAPLLSELLPLPHHVCMATLFRLRDLGLVQPREERWIIAELGYAVVRQLLRDRGYLTDGI